MNWFKGKNGEWNDFYCTARYNFVCKKFVGSTEGIMLLKAELKKKQDIEEAKPKFEYSYSKN